MDNKDIWFRHVAFGYSPDKQIPRLYDVDRGSVKINKVDVRRFDLTYLRGNIGMVGKGKIISQTKETTY